MEYPSYPSPPGLLYVPAITNMDGVAIIAALDQLMWKTVTLSANSRRYQHYGSTYDYVHRTIILHAEPIPACLEPVRAVLSNICAAEGIPHDFNQCIVNDYQPGQGIGKHTDIKAFGPVIGCFTFGSGASMVFSNGEQTFEQYVAPNSLYIMSADARAVWTHEMPARQSDKVAGHTIKRERRVSVTFRYVTPSL